MVAKLLDVLVGTVQLDAILREGLLVEHFQEVSWVVTHLEKLLLKYALIQCLVIGNTQLLLGKTQHLTIDLRDTE